MLSTLFDFLLAAAVMVAWVGLAFALVFIGTFLMFLIGERVYGRTEERGRSCRRS